MSETMRLRHIVAERDAVEKRLHKAIRERIPVGSNASVRHGDNFWPVVVRGHTDWDWGRYHNVTVEGEYSGKVYSVDATRLKEFNDR